ncbi:MAG: glycosyltransferase family 2 protein [Thaumarchaeota archaeon]|nr:glycosyltransferase family 2 protein [Nitrososphaerota archaeon]
MNSNSHNNDKPLISIIIPTKDNVKLLKACIESIEVRSSYKNYEIIIVDNNSKKEETKGYLSTLRHKVLSYPKPFNFSKINNFAVTTAKGEYIIFLNDDTTIISHDWMEKMLEYSTKPPVGVVGVLLLYPNDTIQHAGVLIGVGGIAIHAFEDLSKDDQGYKGLVHKVRECSAVTGACMMIKKSIFEEIGGFDENLSYSFNDVDLCLRLREKGYLVIYTPHAMLYHHGTASRPYTEDDNEIRYFVMRWHDLILKGDPYYDENLSRVRPFKPKRKDEKLVLSETRLFDESEQRFDKRIGKYFEISNKVRKKHGTKRLVKEIIRFLKKSTSQE